MRIIKLLMAVLLCSLSACQHIPSLYEGLSYRGKLHDGEQIEFLQDLTYTDISGKRQTEQQIFDRWFEIIRGANRIILIDMFLYNDYQGPVAENNRAISSQLTNELLRKKNSNPDIRVVVIVDPVNVLYGGALFDQFEKLKKVGVEVYVTDLTKLPDSNPSWSGFWRIFIEPLGNSTKGRWPSPVSEKPITLRSYLSFLNFKANHRKVLIADNAGGLAAIVSSGNLHDATSANSNVALSFTGLAAYDLLQTENAVLAYSGGSPVTVPHVQGSAQSSAGRPGLKIQVVTEGKVRDDLLKRIDEMQSGDTLDIAMFYISSRKIVRALKNAHSRGVQIRLLLDPNRNAMGYQRRGIPNVPVASELHAAGIAIRWCLQKTEQCHSKILLGNKKDGSAWMSLGSTNLTRRNLEDLNLETNIVVLGNQDNELFRQANGWFELLWNNQPDRIFSADYQQFGKNSIFKNAAYLFMEASGWSTF